MQMDRVGEGAPKTPTTDDAIEEDELLDEADEFEEQLAAEMLRTGVIEVWN